MLSWLRDPTDSPASIGNSNLKFLQFPGYRALQNTPQSDRTTELSAQPFQDTTVIVDNDQDSDYSESSDSEQDPRSDAYSAWQEQTPSEGESLATSYNPTLSEEDAALNNEIDCLMDSLDDMIVRTPAATPEVTVPRSRRNNRS